MELFAGYQLCKSDLYVNTLIRHHQDIGEVYFSWDDMPSGRSRNGLNLDLFPWEKAEKQRAELRRIADAGIRLNLLLNANCYGADSLSRFFFQSAGDLVDLLAREWNLCAVTTTSPVIAEFLRANFPDLDVRASVNMEIGTPEGLMYLAKHFTSFYARRELNRDLPALKKLRKFSAELGKKMHLLANSGCLNFCSARQFHDNLVAHEEEISKRDNAFSFHSACRDFLSEEERRRQILRFTNWIRPEDLGQYEGIADGIKIATRIASNPTEILLAYLNRRYAGNVLDLTEPHYADLFYPVVLNNQLFPSDYFEKRHACAHQCESCHYCTDVYDQAADRMTDVLLAENNTEV